MTEKTAIVRELGEQALMLPALLSDALGANDRLKLRLTLLQEASARIRNPERPIHSFDEECRAVGLADAHHDAMFVGARALSSDLALIPGVKSLMAGLGADLTAMLAPLKAAADSAFPSLDERLRALSAALPVADNDQLAFNDISTMTSARHDASDSVHLLVMDAHKAINRLAAATAAETIDGARVHHVEPRDRKLIKAFMAGLHRTAVLAFGHPGLGTTAARVGSRLTVQNDIGTTDAHVLVVHVEDRAATITYTDVHRRRAAFFIALFEGRGVEWTPLAQRHADTVGEGDAFLLVTGRFVAQDAAALDHFMDFLGSRIVFLIDWNKARKALQSLVAKAAAVDILTWAATHDFGHRAFLELGGADLVFEAIRRGGSGRIPYGARFDMALGTKGSTDFLRRVLRHSSQGLLAGRSTRLIRDEIQADLAQLFETAESATLMILVRHLGLTRMLAGRIADVFAQAQPSADAERAARRGEAKRMEEKADRLTLSARDLCVHIQRSSHLRRLIDEIENTTDALDECAFHLSLDSQQSSATGSSAHAELADCVIDSISALVRAVEAASHMPQGHRADAIDALQAIDAVLVAERRADAAERNVFIALMGTPSADARTLVLGLEVARALETATDHLAHAAYALRDRVLEELSA